MSKKKINLKNYYKILTPFDKEHIKEYDNVISIPEHANYGIAYVTIKNKCYWCLIDSNVSIQDLMNEDCTKFKKRMCDTNLREQC